MVTASCARRQPITPQKKPIHIASLEKAINNFHAVQSGVFYRSAQLSPYFLEKMVKKLNIKTIVNLRGQNSHKRWWRKEQALAQKLGITIYDIPMAASRLPQKAHLLTLLDIYEKAQRPILIHCYGGADRTGEAAALWILEHQKNDKRTALKQLSLKYGHFPFVYPAKRFFINLWQGKKWLIEEYNPAAYKQFN